MWNLIVLSPLLWLVLNQYEQKDTHRKNGNRRYDSDQRRAEPLLFFKIIR